MELDLIQTALAIALGAGIANLLDEQFKFVPRLHQWLETLWD